MTDDEIEDKIRGARIGCVGQLAIIVSFLYCIYLGASLNAWPFNKIHSTKPPVTRPAIWYEQQ
jgi:hypothetical protein